MDKLRRLKEAINTEKKGLERLENLIGDDYLAAIELIQSMKGKVVFMGVGKSGHIGKKLAASFSSLGTPAIFIHSTEAVHGDLGMISKDDIVFLLSNSGETKEVLNTLSSIDAIGARKISITSNNESTLAKQSDVSLAYSYEKEADHLNIAPTTSSTLTLVIGDSIAVTLAELNEFTNANFKLYHPGGAIGEQLKGTEFIE